MSGYSEWRFWSPTLGCQASRISMFDEHGAEYFMILPRDDTKAYHEARLTAVEAIATAMAMKLDPGEVRVQ